MPGSTFEISGVYTAGDLTTPAAVKINLMSLPCRDCGLARTAWVVSSGLVVIITVLTVYYNRTVKRVKSGTNEACFK